MIKRLIKNSISSMSVPIIKACITFVMAPVIVASLGNYDYGVWEMVFAVVGYMGMLDIGLTPAIVRSVARNTALNDKEKLNAIYSTSIAFFLPAGLVMALLLLGGTLRIESLFSNAPDSSSLKYSLFLVVIATQVFFTFLGTVFDAFLEGLQEYNMRNNATIFASVVGAVVLYPLLKNGGGLLVLAAGNAIGYILKNMWYGFLLSRKKYGGYRFHLENISLGTFKELFDFGFKSFVYSVSFRIGHVSDSIIIGSFLGPAVVTFYAIPMNFLGQVRNLIWQMTRVFMPAFSELDALADKEKGRHLLFSASKYALGIIIPFLLGICILGPAFLHHWIGPSYAEQGKYVIYIIALAYFFQWLCPFRNRYLTGIGQMTVQARFGVISVVLNLGLSLILVNVLGKEGVAIGTLIPALLLEPYLLRFTCRKAGGTLRGYVREVYVPLFIPSLVLAACLLTATNSRTPGSLPEVFLIACGSMVLYLATFIVFGMRRGEREKLFSGLMRYRTTNP